MAKSQFDNGSFSDKLFDICVRQQKGFWRKKKPRAAGFPSTTTWTVLEGEYYGTYTLTSHGGRHRLNWSEHLTPAYQKGSLSVHQWEVCKEQNDIRGNCLWNIAGRPEGFLKEEFSKWTMYVPSTLRERKQVARLILKTRSATKAMILWAKRKWKGGEVLNWKKFAEANYKGCIEQWLTRLEGIEAPYEVGRPAWSVYERNPLDLAASNFYSYYHFSDTVLRDTIRMIYSAESANSQLMEAGRPPYDELWVSQRRDKIHLLGGIKEIKTWHDRAMRTQEQANRRVADMFREMYTGRDVERNKNKEAMIAKRKEHAKKYVNLTQGVRLLDTQEEYQKEGSEMGHCVGNYYSWSQSVILAVNLQGERSTAEVDESGKIGQHRGPGNKNAPQSHIELVVQIVKSLG